MKIRTDFVTNSSSSGFVVSFDMKFKNGIRVSCELDTSSGDDGEHTTTRVNKHTVSLDEGGLSVDDERLMDPGSSKWEELEEWVWPWDAFEHGGSSFHSLSDLDLLEVKTAGQLTARIQHMCELKESHMDGRVEKLRKPHGSDEEAALDEALGYIQDMKERVLTCKSQMLDELAESLKDNFHSWGDVSEARVCFADEGWGEGSRGDWKMANMIPSSGTVRIDKGKDKGIHSCEDRYVINRNIGSVVSQKYVDGEGFFYEI